MLKYVKGNILSDLDDNTDTVIIHGCNCFNTMGAGLAKTLSTKYPKILEADRSTIKGDHSKLGTIFPVLVADHLMIVNCYTQFYFGGKFCPSKRPVDYEAVKNCLQAVSNMFSKCNIRSPKIGCGLGGGNWDVIQILFNQVLPNATIYYL